MGPLRLAGPEVLKGVRCDFLSMQHFCNAPGESVLWNVEFCGDGTHHMGMISCNDARPIRKIFHAKGFQLRGEKPNPEFYETIEDGAFFIEFFTSILKYIRFNHSVISFLMIYSQRPYFNTSPLGGAKK